MVQDARHTTAKDIQLQIKRESGIDVTYMMAWRAKNDVIQSLNGNEDKQYSQLRSFGLKIKENNPGSYFHLEENDGRFSRLFISLAQARSWFSKSAKLVAMDGTFLKSKFGGTLLLAVTLDPND